MQQITQSLLVQQKKEFDLGVWSSAPKADTETLTQNIFGKYLRQLLFVTLTGDSSNSKNLANIWAKFPQFSEQNTVVLSHAYNDIVDFQRNDIVLPQFEPKLGRTDFLGDSHLSWVSQYLRFILTLEQTVSPDVRIRMEAFGYDDFCRRINKKLRYESQGHKEEYF